MNRFVCPLIVLVLATAPDCYAAKIWARKMEIVRAGTDFATVLRDSVVLTDEQLQLVCRLAVFEESRDMARAKDSVTITTPDGILYADSAMYNLRTRVAELLGRVTVVQESLVISAAKLLYSVTDRQARADEGLVLENAGRGYRLTGKRGYYQLDSRTGIVDSEPVLSWVYCSDTVQATGRLITWRQTSALAVAAGRVRVVSGRGELTCDTALFYADADSGVAWGSPEVLDSRGRASGDTMVFNVHQGSLATVVVRGRADGVYTTDAGDIVDVGGTAFRLWFEQGDITQIDVDRMTTGRLLRAQRTQQ
ncbi:MAG: OstA-like protein [candidate division WOR-3 bacterium]